MTRWTMCLLSDPNLKTRTSCWEFPVPSYSSKLSANDMGIRDRVVSPLQMTDMKEPSPIQQNCLRKLFSTCFAVSGVLRNVPLFRCLLFAKRFATLFCCFVVSQNVSFHFFHKTEACTLYKSRNVLLNGGPFNLFRFVAKQEMVLQQPRSENLLLILQMRTF